ncbi:MAG TPA: RagB/SusD family nutrient uptake outer membrane protein [Gemmatimonadaceae bacterium]|nr:RagB/SusD family nutrient uptake outer membrane protein [Gemmatimonadaceae bacterium]
MKKATRQPMLLGTAMFLAAGSLFGCKESFLTDAAAPQGVLDAGVLANAAGVEGNLIAAYRQIDVTNGTGGFGGAASNWVFGSVLSDDAYKGSDAADFTAITDLERYQWNAPGADGFLNEKWRNTYEGASRANATIRLLKQVVKDNPAALSATDQAGIEGEALFLRAHYMFEAYKIWGNVPYLREDDTDLRKASLQKAAVAAEILKDLDAAIGKLPTTPRKGQVGRVTQWTAKAYKGRLQMFTGAYAAALTTLREVVTSGPYDLQPSYDQVWTGFQAFANGKETIFAYQASANDGEPNGDNANFGERLNFPHSGSPFGCCGFHQPSQNMVNSFVTDATGLPTMITSPSTWNVDNANYTAAKTATMTVDPRLDFTVGRDGVPFKDWGPHGPTWIRDASFSGPYSPKKNVHEKASGAQSSVGWVNTQLNSVNIHLFRYADLLLLLAEAEVEAGSLANALTLVNRVRTRAAAKAQGPGTAQANIAVPINDPSITWAKYTIANYPAFPSQAYARDAVRAERKIELALEGQRFFDLKRWGVLEQVLNDYINGGPTSGGGNEKSRRNYLASAAPVQARHYNFPIPSTQLQLSTVDGQARVPQNTGW